MRRNFSSFGAIQKQRQGQERYGREGTETQGDQLNQMTKQMETLRVNPNLSAKDTCRRPYRLTTARIIQRHLSIRQEDAMQCQLLLRSINDKDPSYEFAKEVLGVCMDPVYANYGLITFDELRDALVLARVYEGKDHREITDLDLITALRKFRMSEDKYAVITIGRGKFLVQLVQGEMSMDHRKVLEEANLWEAVSKSLLLRILNWSSERVQAVLDYMIEKGFAWVDEQDAGETLYWFPCLFRDSILSKHRAVSRVSN